MFKGEPSPFHKKQDGAHGHRQIYITHCTLNTAMQSASHRPGCAQEAHIERYGHCIPAATKHRAIGGSMQRGEGFSQTAPLRKDEHLVNEGCMQFYHQPGKSTKCWCNQTDICCAQGVCVDVLSDVIVSVAKGSHPIQPRAKARSSLDGGLASRARCAQCTTRLQ
jgi:hypothetical protein